MSRSGISAKQFKSSIQQLITGIEKISTDISVKKKRLSLVFIDGKNKATELLKGAPYFWSKNDPRVRRANLTMAISLLSRVIGLLSGVFLIDITYSYLGNERFGLWMTLNSMIAMMVFIDGGLGSGLVNALSGSKIDSNRESSRSLVSSVFFMTTLFSAAFFLVCCILVVMIDWGELYNLKSTVAQHEAPLALLALGVLFAINTVVGIAKNIQISQQEGYVGEIWKIFGQITALLSLYIAVENGFGLPAMLLLYGGATTLFLSLNCLNEVCIRRCYLMPSIHYFSKEKTKALLRTGGLFLVITIANLVGSSTDAIIVAINLGADNVAEYSVTKQIFSIMFVVTLISAPYWPTFQESIASGDLRWARSKFVNLTLLSTVATALLLIPIVAFGNDVILLWLGGGVVPAPSVVWSFAALWLISGFIQPSIYLVQGSRFLRLLCIFTVLYSVVSIVAKLHFVKYFGITGLMWSGVASYAVFFVLPVFIIAGRYLKLFSVREAS